MFIWSSTCFGRHTAHDQEPKLHWQPLVFHTYKVVVRVVGGRCLDNIHQRHVQQPSTYEKPEAASAVLDSWWWAVCLPKHVELHIYGIIKFWYSVASFRIFHYELYYDARIHEHQTHMCVCVYLYSVFLHLHRISIGNNKTSTEILLPWLWLCGH
jgi:hypothetical protein